MQQVDSQLIKASPGWPKVCYGIDSCSRASVVVRAEKRRGKVYWSRVQISNTTLAKAVGDQAVTAVCLSARDSLTRRLEAPFSSRKKALRVLPTLLDIQLPYSIEDCRYEFSDYRKTDVGTIEALAIAATKDNLHSKITSVRKSGFDPEIIDIEGLAVWSQILHETAWQNMGSEVMGMMVVLILDGEQSSLTIGREQHFLNSYGLCADDTKRIFRLVKAHQMKQDEKISWFLAGVGVDADVVSHLKEELALRLHQDVKVVDDPESFLARALAVRALAISASQCNLRSGEITHSRIADYGRRVQLKFAVLWILVGALLCGGNIMMQRTISYRNEQINKKFRGLADSLAGYHITAQGATAVTVVTDSIAARKADLNPFLQAFQPSLLELMADIINVSKKNDLLCEVLSLDYETISVIGTSSTFDASEELAEILVRSGYLVSNKRGNALQNERIPFTITTEKQ